jgi:hypothetical protein
MTLHHFLLALIIVCAATAAICWIAGQWGTDIARLAEERTAAETERQDAVLAAVEAELADSLIPELERLFTTAVTTKEN